MRHAGKISDWNDEKGFGFVVAQGGRMRIFVHIKAFEPGSRRPASGEVITFELAKDERGRPRAEMARFAGQAARMRRSPRRLPRILIASLFLAGVTIAAVLDDLPWVVPAAYGLMSLLSYVLYSFDKSAARNDQWRTPEARLHFFELLGGWPGALIAQQRHHHKTAKTSFQIVFWFCVAANLVLVAWLVRNGNAAALARHIIERMQFPG